MLCDRPRSTRTIAEQDQQPMGDLSERGLVLGARLGEDDLVEPSVEQGGDQVLGSRGRAPRRLQTRLEASHERPGSAPGGTLHRNSLDAQPGGTVKWSCLGTECAERRPTATHTLILSRSPALGPPPAGLSARLRRRAATLRLMAGPIAGWWQIRVSALHVAWRPSR